MTYTITSVRETGTITYHCTTTEMALEKVQDFRRAEYLEITILAADQLRVPESHLVSRLQNHANPVHA